MLSTCHPTLRILIPGVLFLELFLIIVVTASISLSRNVRGLRCLRKKHGLTNGHGDTLGFLKGGTRVNRELLTNKVNQLRRGMNTLEFVYFLHKSGKICGLPVIDVICWRYVHRRDRNLILPNHCNLHSVGSRRIGH